MSTGWGILACVAGWKSSSDLKKSLNNRSNGETYVSLNNVLISLKFVLSEDQRVKLNKTQLPKVSVLLNIHILKFSFCSSYHKIFTSD